MLDSLIGFAVLLVLILVLRVPIAFALALVGTIGFWAIVGAEPAISLAAQVFTDTVMNYSLSVVPLFILMGNLVSKAGLSHELYAASHAFLGHRRGGLAMATIVACGGFSAICGSSLATAATMSKVALPPMRKYGYSDSLATAAIASGGTLGILIPPSVILVIYGFLTETSIRELFAAGFLPGFLGILLYLVAVKWVVMRDPESGPAVERVAWRQRMIALAGVGGTVLLFIVVIGGIYAGLFTPTEAAGIGAFGAFLIAIYVGAFSPAAKPGRKRFHEITVELSRWALATIGVGAIKRQRGATRPPLGEGWGLIKGYPRAILAEVIGMKPVIGILVDTARTTAMLFTILIGAIIFAEFVERAGLPDGLRAMVTGFDVAPLVIMLIIIAIYIVLGCVFESLSMLLLTIPVFFPIVVSLDFGLTPTEVAVWFGIIAVVVTEISLITPPVGLNVFVLSSVLPDVSTSTIFKGVTPFWIVDIVRLAILLLVPTISLFLPNWFYHCELKSGFLYDLVCPAKKKDKDANALPATTPRAEARSGISVLAGSFEGRRIIAGALPTVSPVP